MTQRPQRRLRVSLRTNRDAGLRLALLSGLLLWLACPPVTLWPLAWVAVAPLIVSVTRAVRPRQAVWRGYLFGWFYLGPVWYWTGLTIVGWTHSVIGWLAWFGLTMILAGFYAAWGGLAWWLTRRVSGGLRLTALAAAWVVIEWARTLGTVTMPWAQLSYTQYRFPAILQLADATGAYGISFLIILVNGAAAHWWLERGRPGSTRWLWPTATLVVMVFLYGLARLQRGDEGRPITVAAMQTGISSFAVPSPETQRGVIESLSRQAAQHDPAPSLYVWAESAAPDDAVYDGRTHAFLRDLARSLSGAVLIGASVRNREAHDYANAAILFPPDGGRVSRYDKQQLVPFGEFIPLRGLLFPIFGQAFGMPDDDVAPGRNSDVLRYHDLRAGDVVLGPFICYEAMYPGYARRMTREGAGLLVTQSNDSWFQSRAAMEQHLAAVTLRAIENRREIVRATTTGITCFMDAEGRVTRRAPLRAPTFLTGAARQMSGLTLYTRLGDWFVLLCGILLATILGRRARDTRRTAGA